MNSGLVQSFGCLGYTLRTGPSNHTNPKRKRGSRLLTLALQALMPELLPAIEPGLNSGLVQSYGCLSYTLRTGPSNHTNPEA